jgi:hypothetical protein
MKELKVGRSPGRTPHEIKKLMDSYKEKRYKILLFKIIIFKPLDGLFYEHFSTSQ